MSLQKMLRDRVEAQRQATLESAKTLANAAQLLQNIAAGSGVFASTGHFIVQDAQELASNIARLKELQDLLSRVEDRALLQSKEPALSAGPESVVLNVEQF